MSLATTALRRPVTTVSAVIALCLLGAVSLGRLPVSLLPDVSLPVLTIRTAYEGAAATEVSRFIAEPLEEAVAATPGLAARSTRRRRPLRTSTGWTTRCRPWSNPLARRKSQAFACSRVDSVSYETFTWAPRDTSQSRAFRSVEPVNTVVITRKGFVRQCARSWSSMVLSPCHLTNAQSRSIESAEGISAARLAARFGSSRALTSRSEADRGTSGERRLGCSTGPTARSQISRSFLGRRLDGLVRSLTVEL